MRFREFYHLIEAKSKKEAEDLASSLNKIPKAHKKLLRDYDISFQGDNTLKDGGDNIGENDLDAKKIVISAPWNYGREFALLHEIGHMVWDQLLCPHHKEKWKKIAKATKGTIKQNTEELFCHAYANTYAKNQIAIHTHPKWETFIKELANHGQ